jgi:hypothetical protein
MGTTNQAVPRAPDEHTLGRESPLLIAKAAIVQAFEELGEYDLAEEARVVFPHQVDTDQHIELFLRFGIDPQDLLGRLRHVRPPSDARVEERAVRHEDAQFGSRDRPGREPSSS